MLMLLALPPATNPDGTPGTHLLRLEPEAQRMWVGLSAELEPQLHPDGALGGIQDWAGKPGGAVARIAGLLHLADRIVRRTPWDLPITADTMERAITLGRYFIAHA